MSSVYTGWKNGEWRGLTRQGVMRTSPDGAQHFLDATVVANRAAQAIAEQAFCADLGEVMGLGLTLGQLQLHVAPDSNDTDTYSEEAQSEIRRVIKAQLGLNPGDRVQSLLTSRMPASWLVHMKVPRKLAGTAPDRVGVTVYACSNNRDVLVELGMDTRLLRTSRMLVKQAAIDEAMVGVNPELEVDAIAAARWRATLSGIVAEELYARRIDGKSPTEIAELDRQINDHERGHKTKAIDSGLIEEIEEEESEGAA